MSHEGSELETKGHLPLKSEFSEWYNELLWRAEIMDVRYPVKGLYVWQPFGFSLRKEVLSILKALLDTEHQEVLFPLLIPEHEFMKEAEHIKGFEKEVYWVTHGGDTPLDVPLALRPTSETAIYPMFSLWVRSHADLPLRVYQVVNTFRYETRHTRPLIRLREITSFKEAHTVHATWDEAARQVEKAMELYRQFYDALCIPVVVSKRPEWDKFPGADYTLAMDMLMPDGKTLQVGTAHHLGTNFSKTFEICYEDESGEQQYANQTCYGISERCIAALIALHGDDKGLVLPPSVAPVQIAIVPIVFKGKGEDVLDAAREVKARLSSYRVKLDDSDARAGAKFYYWEMRGVPLRIEIGPRDVDRGQVMVITRLGKKQAVPLSSLEETVAQTLSDISSSLYDAATQKLTASMKVCHTTREVKEQCQKGIALAGWCGNEDCGHALEEDTGADVLGEARIEALLDEKMPERCVVCEKKATTQVMLARVY
ncbi:MAG: proline--tRNA ligase [Methermicoccaceae archaeon]